MICFLPKVYRQLPPASICHLLKFYRKSLGELWKLAQNIDSSLLLENCHGASRCLLCGYFTAFHAGK